MALSRCISIGMQEFYRSFKVTLGTLRMLLSISYYLDSMDCKDLHLLIESLC